MPVLILLVALLGLSVTSRADDVRTQDFPLGSRATGLGGTYTAISNDPSGLYYNPAGLLDTTRASISVSTNLYGVESTRGLAGIDLSNVRLAIVPSEVGGTTAIGEVGEGREPSAVWGFNVMVPSQRDEVVKQRVTQAGGWRDFSRTSSDRTMWLGAGLAWRLGEGLTVGVSAFLLHRSTAFTQSSSARDEATDAYQQETLALDASDDSGLLRGGLKWSRGERWSFGLLLSTPSVALRSSGEASVSRVEWTGAGGARVTGHRADGATDPSALQVGSKLGGALRFGAAYTIPKLATATCDVEVSLPTEYDRFTLGDPVVDRALQLPRQVERRLAVNGSCGAEWRFRSDMSVSVGGFTNFASSPELTARDTTPGGDWREPLPHVDLFGGTLGVGYFGEHSLSRIGVVLTTGSGQDAVYDPQARAWSPRAVTRSVAYAYFASTFRY